MTKVYCKNKGGFDMKFQVMWNTGSGTSQSGWTTWYPLPLNRYIALSNYNIPANTQLWINVAASGGATMQSDQTVTYSPSADNPQYKVTGACDSFTISLEPGAAEEGTDEPDTSGEAES